MYKNKVRITAGEKALEIGIHSTKEVGEILNKEQLAEQVKLGNIVETKKEVETEKEVETKTAVKKKKSVSK